MKSTPYSNDEITIESDDAGLYEASDDIKENDLTVPKDTTPETFIENKVVTNATFFYYFDYSGELLDSVTSDELIFEGSFNGLEINQITINRPIKFTGNSSTFEDVAFRIDSDNVTIDGLRISQSYETYTVNIEEHSNVILSNNIIESYAVSDWNSYAIYAHAVDNLLIINNTISYVGCTYGTVFNNAIRIEGDDDENNPYPSRNITVSGNFFDLYIPSVDVVLDTITSQQTVMNDCIVFYYCEDVRFVGNRISLEYNDFTTLNGGDSLFALSVRSDAFRWDNKIQSANIKISDNTIMLDGHSWVYGICVCADSFEVSHNNITSQSKTNIAQGIWIEGPSHEGTVWGNEIIAKAPLLVYGIYSYQYNGKIEDILYYLNSIEAAGYASAGFETVECNPKITDNTIRTYGNYTYGILADIKYNGIISGNEITSSGSNMGTDSTGDSLMPQDTMGIIAKGNVSITGNNISTTGEYSVDVSDSKATVSRNYLGSAKFIGDDSVLSTGNATVYLNRPQNSILTANAVTATYNIDKKLVITLTDEKGYPLSGLEVSVKIGSAETFITDKNGQVNVPLKGLAPKKYTAIISFNGNGNYFKSEIKVDVTVKKATPKIMAKKKTFKKAKRVKKYKIALKENVGKPIKKVKVTINIGKKTYRAKTNSKGKAKFKIKKLNKKAKYKAVVKFKGNKYYNKVTKKVKITVK